MADERPYHYLRILVVEDRWIVAKDATSRIQDQGCEVVGPAGSRDNACWLARTEALDAALLDVNLGEELVFPVAEILADRGVPFAFATGYANIDLPERYRDTVCLAKPYDDQLVARFLDTVGIPAL